MRAPTSCRCSTAGLVGCRPPTTGSTSFAPSVKRQLEELNITKVRYYKYRSMLVEAGLLRIQRGKRAGARWECNSYYLNADVSAQALFAHGRTAAKTPVDGAVDTVENSQPPIVENSKPQVEVVSQIDQPLSVENFSDGGKPEIVENPAVKPQVNEGFDFDTTQPVENFSDGGKPEIVENPAVKPQVNEGFDFETAQNRTTISMGVSTSIPRSTSLAAEPSVENPPEPEADEADVVAAFDSVLDAAENRNSIRNSVSRAATLSRFRALVAENSLDPWAVDAAWARHQEARRAKVSGPAYMPNLAHWLDDDGPDGALALALAVQAEEGGGAGERPAPASLADAIFGNRELRELYLGAQDARRGGEEERARSLEAEAMALYDAVAGGKGAPR